MAETPLPPAARLLVSTIVIGGLLLTVAVGIIARITLEARGVSVVSWSRGIQLMIPLAIFFEIPFVVLAIYVHRKLKSALAENPEQLSMRLHMYVGAFLGLFVYQGFSLFGLTTYSGPGGFANAVILMLGMWMITVPYMLALGGGASVVGGFFGWLLWRKRTGQM